MWISKEKLRNKLLDERLKASKMNAEWRQEERIEKLEKQVKKLKKIIKEGY